MSSPFESRPVVAVVRHDELPVAETIARAAATALPAVEVTLTVPGGATLIETLCGDSQVAANTAVGAGTVLSPAGARDAIAAGASFLVAPNHVTEVARVAADAVAAAAAVLRDLAAAAGLTTSRSTPDGVHA